MKTHSIFIATLVSLLSFSAFAAQPFCVAHRSLGYGGVENSLEAFEKASKAGAKAIEFDLLHTKDGKTIVQHDGKFGRVTTGCGKRKITEMTLKEIKDHCKLNNGEAIPTLDEALAILSQYNSTLFIEFKDKTITKDDFSSIKSYYSARPDKIMIISFLKNILLEVELKKESDSFYKEVKTLQLKKIGFYANIDDFDGISAKYINKNHVEKLQSMGKLVGVYTKDSEEKIQKYLDKGVDFVTTNNSLLCESLIK
ncbi:glycerophosphodiester phosphodiesterase family protein [Bacteriovorax sp. PP10]|uniref:Glycerophosphodiester phosphodiesterase family protein n=1 Tax=Bacteriovorax antarcticus TaxID=3088717 RepID=A0ABU5VYM0_9BACT|nr:glycerophosphodiester phosphodiesterase family protein [Bacteriovorax sp. PP10]MEA9358158.1 glycerophosphodiester phosphodiesterase family protein [Bacteriovorax sp. PP10]